MSKDLILFIEQLTKQHDPYSDSHAENTATFTMALAKASNYPVDKMEMLQQAASLHDVGKILVPEYVLNKLGKLTKTEYELIHQHPRFGYELISPLELGNVINCVILEHHEAYDGTGYPFGRRGEAICLEARIVKIADTFEALTSDRPYRKALDVHSSVEIMEHDYKLFDPILLEIFVKHVLKMP